MKRWEVLQVPMLAIALTSVLLLAGKTTTGFRNRPVAGATAARLPVTVALDGWQTLRSQPLQDERGRRYQYRQGKILLDVEVRNVVRLPENQQRFQEIAPQLETNPTTPPASHSATPTHFIAYPTETGAYAIRTTAESTELRSCIAQPGSYVTYATFVGDRSFTDLYIQPIVRRLQGKGFVEGDRCLWLSLSIPQSTAATEQAIPLLRSLWQSWEGELRDRLPQ